MTSRARTVVASGGFVGLAIFALLRLRFDDPATTARAIVLLVLPSLLAALGVHSSRVGVHALVRAGAWFALGVATVAAWELGGRCWITSLLATVSIVALGSPSYEEAAERSGFTPIAFRRTFLGSVTASLVLAAILGVTAGMWFSRGEPQSALVAGTCALGLVGSAVLVLRMRAVGVALALLTALASLGLSLTLDTPPSRMLPVAMRMLTTGTALSFALPVLWSWREPARVATRSKRGVAWSSLLAVATFAVSVIGTVHNEAS